jgi:hypothetical protein
MHKSQHKKKFLQAKMTNAKGHNSLATDSKEVEIMMFLILKIKTDYYKSQ